MKFIGFALAVVAIASFGFGYALSDDHLSTGLLQHAPVIEQGGDAPRTPLEETLLEVAQQSFHEHTYMLDEGYVCVETTVDVWNLLKTRGIDSTIMIGNYSSPCEDFSCANHAWIVVDTPTDHVAIQTTRGYISHDPLAFVGMRFANPKEFQDAWSIYHHADATMFH